MITKGFTEVETPILFRSTPEGAREFLVPADRILPGSKFALPQSPQQFKQMLMASGFDRYYQIARCFRDEDLRADRQPEFTQLDMEMSFVTMEDVMSTMEDLIKRLWKSVLGREVIGTIPRVTYNDALATYGSDKPDLRYPFTIKPWNRNDDGDIKHEVLTLSNGPNDKFDFVIQDFTKEDLAKISTLLRQNGRDIIAWVDGEDWDFKKDDLPTGFEVKLLVQRNLTNHVGTTFLGKVRNLLIKLLEGNGNAKKHQRDAESLLWVYDFPLLAKADLTVDSGLPSRSYESMHHPFTAPVEEDIHLLATDPLRVRGQHYDLVFNGCEIGGGSIRIHSAELQERILRDIIKLPESYISHFDHLLNALRSGCPPHGGIALGLDRIMAIMCESQSIRDVIAFPKNSAGFDVCVRAPGGGELF